MTAINLPLSFGYNQCRKQQSAADTNRSSSDAGAGDDDDDYGEQGAGPILLYQDKAPRLLLYFLQLRSHTLRGSSLTLGWCGGGWLTR